METQEFKSKLKEVVGYLTNELLKIRSNRASPALVEDILVEYFGNKTPIKSMASISSLDARTLVIEPWDKNALEPIAKAIANASIGAQPIVDSKSVRLSLPQLTQERRQELAKLVSQKIGRSKDKNSQIAR